MLAAINRRITALSGPQSLRLLALNSIIAAVCVFIVSEVITWNTRRIIRSVETRTRANSSTRKTTATYNYRPVFADAPMRTALSSSKFIATRNVFAASVSSQEQTGPKQVASTVDKNSGLLRSETGFRRNAFASLENPATNYLQSISFFGILFVLQFYSRPSPKSDDSKTELGELKVKENAGYLCSAICKSYLFVFERGYLIDANGLGLEWLGLKRESDCKNLSINSTMSLMPISEDRKSRLAELLASHTKRYSSDDICPQHNFLGMVEEANFDVSVFQLEGRQVVAVRDDELNIDERIRRWDQLERSKTELDELVYFASHDLRAPLNSISMLVEMILDEPSFSPSEETMTSFDMLRRRVFRMDMLFTEILRYSRVGRLLSEKQIIDAKATIQQVLGEINAKAFQIQLIGKSTQIDTFPEEFKNCIKELVDNAVVHHDRPDGLLQISLQIRGKYLEIRFANDGPQIEPKYYGKIFKMFGILQRRDEVENAGVGLPIARKTVETFGGSLTVEEPTLGGADFLLRWPIQSLGPTKLNWGRSDKSHLC